MVNSIAKYTVDLDINDINHKKVKPKTTRTKYVARANSPSSSMANGKLTINKKKYLLLFSVLWVS